MLSGVVFTDIATLEEFHADDLGMIFVPNNGGDDPNPNVLLAARPYCVGFQGTPNRLGVYRVSMDVIFTANAGGDIEFEYTIDVALTVQSIVPGCTDEAACNYDSEATQNDGSCDFTSCLSFGCTDPDVQLAKRHDNGTCADWTLAECVTAPAPFSWMLGHPRVPAIATATNSTPSACAADVTEDSNNNGVWHLQATGCTDEAACNYDVGPPTTAVFDARRMWRVAVLVQWKRGCDPIAEALGSTAINSTPSGFAAAIVSGQQQQCLCDAGMHGCTLENACNFNESATFDDGSCEFFSCVIVGCTDPNASNNDAEANFDSGACLYDSGCDEEILGCTYISAQNFDPAASLDDGTCNFVGPCDYLE